MPGRCFIIHRCMSGCLEKLGLAMRKETCRKSWIFIHFHGRVEKRLEKASCPSCDWTPTVSTVMHTSGDAVPVSETVGSCVSFVWSKSEIYARVRAIEGVTLTATGSRQSTACFHYRRLSGVVPSLCLFNLARSRFWVPADLAGMPWQTCCYLCFKVASLAVPINRAGYETGKYH